MGTLTLVTGGVRSGKSGHALELARRAGGPVLFVATALASDDEMRERIEKHRAERPADWATVEATEGPLAGSLGGDHPAGREVLLLDCLTLYVSRRLTDEAAADDVFDELEAAVLSIKRDFRTSIVVTNEVGSGVIPANELARRFTEVLGRANRLVAARADRVLLMVSGIPVEVK